MPETLLAPLGLLGNRILFALLTLIAFIAWLLQRGLDESQEWVEQKQKEKETGERPHPYKDLFSNAVSVKSVLFLIGVYMFWNLVAGAMGFFMLFVYETVGDLSNLQANLLQAVLWIFTALAGYFGFAMYGDKVSHRGFYFVGACNGSNFMVNSNLCWYELDSFNRIRCDLGYLCRYWCASLVRIMGNRIIPN